MQQRVVDVALDTQQRVVDVALDAQQRAPTTDFTERRTSPLAPRPSRNILPHPHVLNYAKRAAAVSILLGILPYHS